MKIAPAGGAGAGRSGGKKERDWRVALVRVPTYIDRIGIRVKPS